MLMQGAGRRRRRVGFISGAMFLVAVSLLGCSNPEPYSGTELRPAEPAMTFELRNQFSQQVSLSDYAGNVVLVTFLYTNCPDVCPIVTSQLSDAHAMLGDDASGVVFAAISVDPRRDSVQAAYAYSEKWDMTDKWDFLVGDEGELSPIWKAYFLDPAIDEGSHQTDVHTGEESQAKRGVSGLRDDISDGFLVIHSTPVYLIDRDGIKRVVFTPPLDPEALVHDIRLLLE